MDNYDVIVVGGGVCGLTAAQQLHQQGKSVLIVDKAKRLGGRVASGKIGNQLLDVGVPCTSAHLGDLQQLPEASSTFSENMGSVAADLCNLWSKEFTWRQGFVTNLVESGPGIAVVTEFSGASFVGSSVILTCPPEQSAHLLGLSGLTPPAAFEEISHTKEMLLLVEAQLPDHQTALDSAFLTVHQQTNSDTTELTALALRASASWSEQMWDRDAQNVRALLLKEFSQMFPGVSALRSETKRWRYANASTTTAAPFVKVGGKSAIYCAGDGFGDLSRSGLSRAVGSGTAVANHLLG
jgi:predicted NAD/FAD-dependent oxidoreductase